MEAIRNPNNTELTTTKEVYYLQKEFEILLEGAVQKIQETHKGKHLEKLIAKTFRSVPNVEHVQENGSGYRTDHGADLIITYKMPTIGMLNLEKVITIVAQVKSYIGDHKDVFAVEQLKIAIEKYNADFGLLITTGNKTDELEKAIDEYNSRDVMPKDKESPEKEWAKESKMELLAGVDVARFILNYGKEYLWVMN